MSNPESLKRGVQSIFLALFFALTTLFLNPMTVALADQSEDLERQLEEAVAQLDSLEETLNRTEAELGRTSFELGETVASISDLEDRIASNSAELEIAKAQLSIVIGETYRQHESVSLLSLILSSSSLDEMVSRIYYANKVSERKHQAITAVSELQASLKGNRSALEDRLNEQEKLLAAQQTQKEAVEDAAYRQAQYVDQLSDEVKQALEEKRKKAAEESLAAARRVLGDEAVDQALSTSTEGEENKPATEPAENKDDAAEQSSSEPAKAPAAENSESAPQDTSSSDDATDNQAQSESKPESNAQPAANPSTQPSETANSQPALTPTPAPVPKPAPTPEPEPEPTPAPAPEPEPTPAPTTNTSTASVNTTPSSSYSSNAANVAISAALAQVGKPYGHSNNGYNWDCNGLTHYAWSKAGVSIPYASGHYAYGQFQWMKASGNWVTSASALKPGDLVFFSYDGGWTTYHVALYIGEGQIVHAVGYSQGVQVTSLNYVRGFCGGGSPI